jgi:MiaB-like tRNA modifying enzyme
VKFFIRTYGCAFNRADSDALAFSLKEHGHEQRNSEDSADLIIVNSCGVKEATEQKILFELSRLEKIGKKLIVTGCLAQATPKLVEKAAPSASVIGTFATALLPEFAERVLAGEKIVFLKKGERLLPKGVVDGKICRLQISQGCLGNCSFCQTKLARGRLVSYPIRHLVSEAKKAVRKGAVEIQLCSQDCACYGFDFVPKQDLATLLKGLTAIPGNFRIRIGMGNPEHFSKILPRLLEAMMSEKIYKFLHIPLQAGSNAVLKEMKRNYSVAEFKSLVKKIRNAFPRITLETDMIVGFPTENEADFKESMNSLWEIKFDVVNVSKFSSRPRTLAFGFKKLPNKAVKSRSSEMSSLCARVSSERNKELFGETLECVIVEKGKKGMQARSQEYKPVILASGKLGEFVAAKIVSSKAACLFGRKQLKQRQE